MTVSCRSRTAPFLRDESGAVSIDWAVLTAAVCGLGVAVAAVVSVGAQGRSDAFVVQTEVWRKGEGAIEAYDAINQDSFIAMFGIVGTLSEAQLNDLNAFTNAYVRGVSFEDEPAQLQATFTDLDAAIRGHYAEQRDIRPAGEVYDGETVAGVWNDNNFLTLYGTYGDDASNPFENSEF